jgi:hypothetical protein
MCISMRFGVVVALLLTLATAQAEETKLFNGKDLDGWTFHPQSDDQPEVEQPWIAQQGMLINRGVASGYLIHKDDFENYVLTLEVRTMSTEEGNGLAIGSLGSVFINAGPEKAEVALMPKAIEISISEPGDVYFRDIDVDTFFHHKDKWLFSAPDFPEDVDREMGEWNQLNVISNEKRLTVFLNDKVVNQVESMNRTKGAFAIKSDRGAFVAPTFYRNIVIREIREADLKAEKQAQKEFAKVKTEIAQRQATEDARRAKEERMRVEAEQRQQQQQQKLAKEWTDVPVANDVKFTANVRHLPYPKDAQEIEFSSVFDTVEFESPSSLKTLSTFYRSEMAKRGWQVTETDIEEDEVTVSYRQGDAEVELNLDEGSDTVDVSLDCEELSFDGTDDPSALAKMSVPQPQEYLVLQSEFALPDNYRDQEYDMGKRRLFKSTMKLPELYEFLTQQLRKKGYRETRRPIISDNRQYSVFAKGRVKLSVNTFEHEIGSRVVLTYEK